MRLWLLALLLALPLAGRGTEAVPVAADPAVEQRLMTLATELRCLVCQNETLADSPAELARDLRQEIRELMRAGQTDDQIVHYLTARYGDFVLYRPPVKPVTWLLWFGPFALLLGAIGGFCLYFSRRNRRLEEERSAKASAPHAAPVPEDERTLGS